MDLLHVLRTNGSVRTFRSDPVDDATIARILDTARFAPSGGNKQGWHVIVVKDPGTRAQLQELAQIGWNEYVALAQAGQRPFAADESGHWPGPRDVDLAAARSAYAASPMIEAMTTVPVLLVVAADLAQLAAVDTDLDRIGLAAGASVYPFANNVLLAARAEGLGGVLTTFVVREEPTAKELLGLPKRFAIAALIAIGAPEHQNTKLTRRPVEAFATFDRFDGPPLTAEGTRR
jgi:nitroreductase